MRDYAKVSPRFWTGETGREIRKLGRDAQVIAREILHAWATKKIHEASVLAGLAAAEGLVGEREGARGSGGAAKGGWR